jgi:hypothetical protein
MCFENDWSRDAIAAFDRPASPGAKYFGDTLKGKNIASLMADPTHSECPRKK